MDRRTQWLLPLSWALIALSLLLTWASRNTSASTKAMADTARDTAIIKSLKSATRAQIFRSDSPHPRLIPLSLQQQRKIISYLRFVPSDCTPATFPTPMGAKDKAVAFSFDLPKGSSLVILNLNGSSDFYGDSPPTGKKTRALLCPESSRALRDFLFREPSMKEIIAPR